jgi:hypothetical protein
VQASVNRRRSPHLAPEARELSYKEARELDALPDRLAALEQEQAAVSERLTDPLLYRNEPDQVSVLKEKLAAIETELADGLVRWEALESRVRPPTRLKNDQATIARWLISGAPAVTTCSAMTPRGRLVVTDDYLRAYYLRPELAPNDASCAASANCTQA